MSDRTRLTRKPERGSDDPAVLHRLLDEARIAHVGFVRDGSPVVLPMAMGRDGDRLLLHGSTGAGMFLAGRTGIEVSVAVTHLDGLVLARSAFDHSMNYRSAVLFGVATPVPPGEKEHALRVLTEHLVPGRWDEVRSPTPKELAATMVLEVPLTEMSVKIRVGGPGDDPYDGEDHSVWAGVVPLHTVADDPIPSPTTRSSTPLPRSVRALL
ncbi:MULTISPECIES: pyridoxamine 5'-phosphate oxidase family protein [Rhodococcus]|uniref:Pyridoxamine 5'-phosphate oxidase family protein n=1 Tax=Rhodococcus rhodochrous TaxID=1829 RepID=A0AA46X112_RHORH|nr:MULTISPECIES: pyridoxamine 5'-phosphate oxidase family protein [Rhodococcus]MCR8692368.1 pyridoxamine 5'-phosphate oxidase family protein [Rhodococcus pyridinivorans]MDC3726507.1 pyridoxamine 5'-phosphate oxidase family protein [Rhodococcus sp. Rp3]UZF47384.1 pyridoxamine 5'-phosphate oxidase family protein [Rhodococcus rhodochrous]WSE24884.1 pyridoxamine 5'-phosphate oxidase family protein [Rhodococcus sp. PD04]